MSDDGCLQTGLGVILWCKVVRALFCCSWPQAAAAMAGALRPMGGGHGKYPLVRGIGTLAIHRALVAAYLAQTYLDNDDRGVRFLVVPRFVQEETQTGSGFRNQLVLRLVRWAADAPKGCEGGCTCGPRSLALALHGSMILATCLVWPRSSCG